MDDLRDRAESREHTEKLTKEIGEIIHRNYLQNKDKKREDRTEITFEDVLNYIENYNEQHETDLTHHDISGYLKHLNQTDNFEEKKQLVKLRAHYCTLERLIINIQLRDRQKVYEEQRPPPQNGQ